jgi:nicotinate-nucleotide adenylyltransferase
MVTRRIVLFGGTFDPVHFGHTAVATAAAEHIVAEKVIFIPAKRSPLKNLLPCAGDNDRFAMIKLAIAGDKKFEVNDCEVKKNKPSYTLDTVWQFKGLYGDAAEIYWLIGADAVNELMYWYRIAELIDECNLCTMYRGGYKAPDFTKFANMWGQTRVEKLQGNIIKTPLIDISSTEIRKRLAAGEDVSEMIHPAVAEYIKKHGLYK